MIFLILTFLILSFLAIFTITNLYKYKRGWILLLLIFLYGVWTVANFLYPRLEDYETALFFSKLIFSSTPPLVWSVLLLTFYYPVTLKYRKLGYLVLLVTGAWALIETYIGQFTDGIILYLKYNPDLGHYVFHFNSPAFLHYVVFISLVLGLSVYFLYVKYKESSGRLLLQLRYLFWGFLIGFATMGVTNMLLPMAFGIFQYSDIGPFFSSTMLVTITYSSMIDRLHDLRYLFHNILIWSIKIFVVFFLILLFFLFSARLLQGTFPPLFDEIILAILGISVLITYFTHRFSVHEFLEGSKKNEVFANLESEIAVELRLEKLGDLIIEYIKSALGVEDILVLIFEQGNRDVIYKMGEGNFKPMGSSETSNLLDIVDIWRGLSKEPILSKDELRKLSTTLEPPMSQKAGSILDSMDKHKVEMIVPLNRKVALNGILVMGEKLDSLPFTVQDYFLLEKIIRIASVAFGRAILYQKVASLTENLQKQVDEQTKELRIRMEHMEGMRQREKDLIDIMGHELRTPLTIVRNSLELVDIYKKNQRKKKKIVVWDSNFQKQFEYIKAAIRREMGIVETLLSATKLDAKKVEPHFSEVDLIKIVDVALLGFEKEAQKKELKLKIAIDRKKKWVVKADSLQIQQVVDNLLSNAIKYTHKGFVKVELKDQGKKISIIISDTGEGMDKGSIRKLGQKFHRLNQYVGENGNGNGEPKKTETQGLVRPGGTGLGLYVAFGLVKVMEGTYDVQSELGKGSVFTVTFKKP